MHSYSVVAILFFCLSFQVASKKVNLYTAWNPKKKAYKTRKKEYKKAEQKRLDSERVKYRAVRNSFSKKEQDLEKMEKAEVQKMKEDLYKDFSTPKINPAQVVKSKDNYFKDIKKATDLRIEEIKNKKLISFKYKKLAIDLKEELNAELEKVATANLAEWQGLYNRFQMAQAPQPDPEIETVPRGKREKEARFLKSKIRLYKKAIIEKRNAIYQPKYKARLIEINKKKSAIRLEFDRKTQNDYEANFLKSIALQKELKQKVKELSKEGESAAADIKELRSQYAKMAMKLDEEKQGIHNKRQREKSAAISLVDKAFIAELKELKKKLQSEILATKPGYVQAALRSEK